MRVEVMALVIRDKRNQWIIDVIPLDDQYASVQVEYTSEYVTPNEIKVYVESWMGANNPMALRAEKSIADTGIWIDEQEAKDFSNVGNLLIGIESKVIDWD